MQQKNMFKNLEKNRYQNVSKKNDEKTQKKKFIKKKQMLEKCHDIFVHKNIQKKLIKQK